MLLVAESPLALPESVLTSISDWKRFFQSKFVFYRKFLVMAFSIFCLRLVHQSSFTLVLCLDAVYVCLQSLRVVESFFFFLHLLYFQKIQKHLLIIMHCILHFALYLHQIQICFGVLVRTSYRKHLHSSFEEELCISRSSIPYFHGHNAFALIVRCAFYFLLHHNTTSCTIISLFE